MLNIKRLMLLLLLISNMQAILGQGCCTVGTSPQTITNTAFPLSFAITPSGSCAVVGDQTSTSLIIYSQTATCTYNPTPTTIPIGNNPTSLSFSPTGSCLAVAIPSTGTVQLYAQTTGCTYTASTALTGFTNIVQALISPTGTCLAVADFGAGTVSIYPLNSNCSVTASPSVISAPNVAAIAFSPDASCIAISQESIPAVNIYPLISGCTYSTTPSTTFTGLSANMIKFSNTGSCFLANSATHGIITIYPRIAGCIYSTTPSTTITPVLATVQSVSFSPTDSCLAITSITFALAQNRAIDPSLAIYPLTSGCTYATTPTTNITVAGGAALATFASGTGCLGLAIQDGISFYSVEFLGAAISPAIQVVCSTQSINFTATAIQGTAPFTYLWTGPNGFSESTGSIPSLTIPNPTALNTGIYTVTITDSLGCSASASTEVVVSGCSFGPI